MPVRSSTRANHARNLSCFESRWGFVVTDQDRLWCLCCAWQIAELTAIVLACSTTQEGRHCGALSGKCLAIKALGKSAITTFDDGVEEGALSIQARKATRNGGVILHTTGLLANPLPWCFLLQGVWSGCWAGEMSGDLWWLTRAGFGNQFIATFMWAGFVDERLVQGDGDHGARLAQQIGRGQRADIFSIINKFGTAWRCRNAK